MGVVPSTIIGQIQFFENHIGKWAVAPTTIGLTAAQVTSITALTSAARAAYEAAEIARMDSKNATEAMSQAVTAMRGFGGDLVKTIRAYAQTTNQPQVYTDAAIPAPAPPSPAPPPGIPTDLVTTLLNNGAVQITWKAANAAPTRGTYFTIFRKLPGETAFTRLGDSAKKHFTDTTIPAGTAWVSYMIQPKRPNYNGPYSEQITTQFGGSGSLAVQNTGSASGNTTNNGQEPPLALAA